MSVSPEQHRERPVDAPRCRRVAALYDIHGNLPALDAVLAEVRTLQVDCLVIGGDVLPGPMPRATMERLLEIEIPTTLIYGNGDRAVLAQLEAATPHAVSYWGTSSGVPLPPPFRDYIRWNAQAVTDLESQLASWPFTATIDIAGVGRVLFCHATPRNEIEIFTTSTPEERLEPVFAGVDAPVVVCGHTHMQFDRQVGSVRVVNAGSVGMPFGAPGAYWLLLGPGIELRNTTYDVEATAAQFRRTDFPMIEDLAVRYLLEPLPEEQARAMWATMEL
jgi:predicted phosphodiesterase